MLIISIIHIIISVALNVVKNISIIYSRIIQLITIYSIYITYKLFFFSALKNGISLFNGVIKISLYSDIFSIFLLIITFLILFLTSFYPILLYKTYIKGLKSFVVNELGHLYDITEYCLILIFIISGSLFIIINNDIITLFLAIELQSYGLYLVSTIFKDSESSTKAGLTYFLLGGLSSCIILLALSLLYINFGNTSLENIYILYDIFNISNNEAYYTYNSFYINIILVVLSVGLLFKISAAPFHFWSPDVYDNIPTVVTTFVAIIGKISILIVLLEMCVFLNNNYNNINWINNIVVSSLLSLIIGSLLGLTQSRIKRLYAYSTISHIGFILLALSINSIESTQAFIFYVLQYSISNLNAFILLIAIGYYLYNFHNKNKQNNNLKHKKNSPIQLISQLKGLSTLNPFLASSLTITILSFLGIPPLIGFFGKQMVLSASLDGGYLFMSLIIVLTSVIAGVYYLAIIKEIYFNKPDSFLVYNTYVQVPPSSDFSDNYCIIISNSLSIVISVITILIVTFIIIPDIPLNLLNLITVFI